jgi:hypothetical protein
MARYKHIDVSPRFLAVDLKRQLLPGTRPCHQCVRASIKCGETSAQTTFSSHIFLELNRDQPE